MTDKRSQLRFPPAEMLESSSTVERKQVETSCPDCDSEDVAAYPTLRYKGWFEITRCQDCLELIDEEAMDLHGFWTPWTEDMKRSR